MLSLIVMKTFRNKIYLLLKVYVNISKRKHFLPKCKWKYFEIKLFRYKNSLLT